MSNNVIFFTQISAILVFVLALFTIYSLLVAQKDGVIELLREQMKAKDIKIKELETQAPDILVKSLSERIEISVKEVERLKKDGDKHKAEIEEKETELHGIKERLTTLVNLIKETDLLCPKCGAPLSTRQFHTISDDFDGREIEVDIEYTTYECGLEQKDGCEMAPCKTKNESEKVGNLDIERQESKG